MRLKDIINGDRNTAHNITTLAENKTWRPEIVEENSRLIAAAIHFLISGKKSKRRCVDFYVKTGVIPRYQKCRKQLADWGVVPQKESDKEKEYWDNKIAKKEKEEAERIRKEVEFKCETNLTYEDVYTEKECRVLRHGGRA